MSNYYLSSTKYNSIFIIMPMTLALFFRYNKKLLKLMPKINLFLNSMPFKTRYYTRIENMDTTKCEIPIFDNAFLDYKATEDFSENLSKVSILEHPIYMIKRNIFNKNNTKSELEYEFWKVIFEFKSIPKNGYLEIHYL